MVAAVSGIDTQTGVGLLGEGNAPLAVTQVNPLAVYNFPASTGYQSQDMINILAESNPASLITQALSTVVYQIRPDDPRVRCWTYSMDGHDFYILQLGENETLVYDVYSEQWMEWADRNVGIWNLSTGRNWIGGLVKSQQYGSNVIVGDNANGAIYFLDPEYIYDDGRWNDTTNTENNTFTRYATGQIYISTRDYAPCWGVSLYGSIGENTETGTVTLRYSDDSGHTYISAGDISVPVGGYSNRLDWLSLGSMTYPGRLFRLEDTGAIARIDSLEFYQNDTGTQ